MSMGAEMLTDLLIEYEIMMMERADMIEKHITVANSKLWVTREGETMHISKMSSRHIRNSLNMLQRRLDFADEDEEMLINIYIGHFNEELQKRKHPPQDATEGFFESFESEVFE